MDSMTHPELPIGFGFALAQNPEAMQVFTRLPEASQAKIVQRARAVSSKQEIQTLVDSLTG